MTINGGRLASVRVGMMVVALGAAFALGGCGAAPQDGPGPATPRQSADKPKPKGCQPQKAVAVCVAFEFDGAVKLSGTEVAAPVEEYFEDAPTSCTDWAATDAAYIVLRTPEATSEPGGEVVELANLVPNDGLGRATEPKIRAKVKVDGVMYGSELLPSTHGTVVRTPDGSGSFELDELEEIDSGKTISGTVRWTCMEPV